MNISSKTVRRNFFVTLLVLAFCLAVPFNSHVFAAEDRLSVEIGNTAKLLDGGQAVELKVKVRCSIEDFQVLEAFVYVVQDGNQSLFGPLSPVCGANTGVQVFRVRVDALDFSFRPGEATATAFILLLNPETQETIQAQDQTTILIR